MYRLLNMTPVHVSRARGPGLVFVVLCAVASAFSHGAAALRVVPMTPFVENNSTLGLLLAAKPVHTSANRRSLQSVTCTAGYPVTCSSGLGCCTLTYPVCCTGAKAGYCGLNAASCATSSTNYAAYSSDTVTCPNTLFYSCPKATPTCCKSYGNYVGALLCRHVHHRRQREREWVLHQPHSGGDFDSGDHRGAYIYRPPNDCPNVHGCQRQHVTHNVITCTCMHACELQN